MRLLSVFLGLSVAGGSFGLEGPPHLWRRDNIPTAPTEVDRKTAVEPKRFIVEFAEGTDAQAEASELATKAGTKVLKVFNSDIFKGCAVEAETENLDSLSAKEAVSQAWISRKIMLAPAVPSRKLRADAVGTNYSIHHMTGVDKLHAAGILGKGCVVAVVDSGVDYNHPALGGGIGPGFKIASGYDLVGDGNWPDFKEQRQPDADPLDTRGHGTHVSGIVAGKSDKFTGVAPDATLLAYKVFSNAAVTYEETLIEAFLMAYDAGADVITSSVGGINGWTNNPWAVVASRLVDQGVVVTISAANDGQAGPFAASSGASGDHVLSVASVEADVVMTPSFIATFNLDQSSNESYVGYLTIGQWYPSEVKGWPIIPLTFDTTITNDACSPLPADTPSLSNTIVLVRRGGCTFIEKQTNVAAFNASHLLLYNNQGPLVVPELISNATLIASIAAEAGAAIIETIKAGGNVTADFSVDPLQGMIGLPNGLSGGRASSFTTIGATNELFIKPDIAAPGGQILSTYLGGGWAILSGTSMACPYVAGVAALYIGKHGGRKTHGAGFAKDLAMRIISSGEAIPWDDGNYLGTDYGFSASVAQVGTGLINAVKVLEYDTSLSFSKFALNDTHHFSRYQKVDISNKGTKPITYTFEAQEFGGMETYVTDPEISDAPRVGFLEDVIFNPSKMSPSISFPGGTFTVNPGETKTAQFNFMYPQGLDATKLPMYSGKVLIKGNNNETLGIPYLGLAADLSKDIGFMFQYPIGLPSIYSTPAQTPLATKSNFTFDLGPSQDFPKVYSRLNYATRELRWDIFDESWVERDWKYPPVVGQAGYIGSVTTWAQASGAVAFDPVKDDVNDLLNLPWNDLPRDLDGVYGTEFWWFGRLANGTQIAPGKYKMRFAALFPYGAPSHSDNWDVFQTPGIEVLPLKK